MLIVKGSLGASLTILLTFAYGVLSKEVSLSAWQIGVGVAVILSGSGYGLYRLWDARFLNADFVAAVRIAGRIRRIRGFLEDS